MEVFIKPKLAERTGSLTTTGAAYDVIPDDDTGEEYFLVKGYRSKIIQLKCTLNDLIFKIDVSLDATNWHNIKDETTLAKDAVTYETLTEPWNYLRVQIKPANGNGKMAVAVGLSSL